MPRCAVMNGLLLVVLCAVVVQRATAFTPAACGDCPSPYPKPCLQFTGPPPDAPVAVYEEWLTNVSSWAKSQRQEYHLSDALYGITSLAWTQRAYLVPQMHPFDLYFYNKSKGEYTPERYLQDVLDRYGGVEGVLLWPTYPNMGIDDRNQYDWFRSLPFGGLEQLSNVVQVLREQYNVQVMLPYNPWDVGTRREPVADPEAMAQLLKNTSAVGFNGDTMVDIPEAFFTAALSAGLPGVVLQPENGGLPDSMNWTSMAWGYWSYPPDQPCVDADRWVARRRMTGVCERWAQDKTDNIHSAYVNGVGYVPWENVWGTWNGITPQGGELIRRYATILRWVQPSLRLNGESWRPLLTPYCLASHVFASSWDVNSTDDVSDPTLYLAGIRRVYLLVNRGNESVDTHSPMLNLTVAPDTLGGWASSGPLYIIDCYHGTLLTEWSWTRQSQWLVINGSIGPRDLGCVAVATTSPFDNESQQLSGEWREFLANMQNLTATPLSSYSNVWYPLPQTMMDPQSPHRSTHPAAQASHEGMLKIPGTSDYTFTSSGIEIEGPPDRGVDFQFPWETYPSRHHGPVNLTMPTFYMDEVLVTMVEYEVYLNTSGYVPADDNNFLRKWTKWHSSPPRWVHPAGGSRSPVTWISLDEAAMYCAYYGKRLPRPFEWQYAAQGSTGDRTPWAQNESKYCIPPTSSASEMPLPPSVDLCVEASSVFGVRNLIGFVWQWTWPFEDLHTRAALIKGGSYYRPSGSGWYMRQSTTLDTHNKYLLMDDSYDRSGGVGFRCVVDA